MAIRVYKYGLLAPTQGVDELDEQLLLASRYYNALIRLERDRRDEVRAFDDGDARATLEAATEARLEAVQAVKAYRAQKTYEGKKKTRKVPAQLQEALTEAKKKEKDARKVLKEARARLRAGADYQEHIKSVHEQFTEKQKQARGESGLYSGTYQLVENAFTAAKKLPMWNGADPQNPKFQPYKKGVGSVGVQIPWPNNAPPPVIAETVMAGAGTKVFLADGTPREGSKRDPRSNKSKKRFMQLHLRIKSDEKRNPVWAVFPMVLHRPLPAQCVIKRVDVHCTSVAGKRRFEVCFSVIEKPHPVTCGKGAVAIDIGWRQMEERSLRVAVARDEEGAVEEAYASPETLSDLDFVDQLRSIRDRSRDDMQKKLVEWLRTQEELPEWMRRRTVKRHVETPSSRQACAYLSGWKASARFAALAFEWRDNRFEGDEMAYSLLESWRKQDKHVWEREAFLRRKAINRRLDGYRVWANEMAKKYSTLILADVDLSKVAEKPKVQDAGDNEHARTNRQRAAVFTLRLALINAFTRRGGGVFVPLTTQACTPKKIEMLDKAGADVIDAGDSFDKTMQCAGCGEALVFDKAAKLHVECGACGVCWDQDVNAAQNLLNLYTQNRERYSAVQNRRVARDRQKDNEYGGLRLSRKEKNAIKRKKRQEREEAARNRVSEPAE